MITKPGNIWDLATHADAVVIPTSVGWRRNGLAVMGRGLALQAANRFRGLEEAYGQACKEQRSKLGVIIGKFRNRSNLLMTLVMFPTKPMNSQKPWLSWRNPASMDLINRGLGELHALNSFVLGNVYLPLLGCGEGGLDPVIIEQSMNQALPEDRYVLVRLKV